MLNGTTRSETSSVDDKHVAHFRLSITAEFEFDDTDLVNDVHWNHSSVCAQFQYSGQTCIQPVQAHRA